MEAEAHHNYQAQATKIAVEAFLNFDDVTKARFFDFLKEVYADKKEIYRFFYTQYANLRVGKAILSKHQKKEILAVILPFVPLEQQFYLMQCEVLQYLQERKQYLTYRGKYAVNFSEFSSILNTYFEDISSLYKKKTSWFYSKSYQEIDRADILNVIRYVTLKKMLDNVENMKQDFQIMLNNKKGLSTKCGYLFYFLGLKINVRINQINFYKITLVMISRY